MCLTNQPLCLTSLTSQPLLLALSSPFKCSLGSSAGGAGRSQATPFLAITFPRHKQHFVSPLQAVRSRCFRPYAGGALTSNTFSRHCLATAGGAGRSQATLFLVTVSPLSRHCLATAGGALQVLQARAHDLAVPSVLALLEGRVDDVRWLYLHALVYPQVLRGLFISHLFIYGIYLFNYLFNGMPSVTPRH